MSEQQPRRFPFWLTLSVLGNLVLLGLVAGIFLRTPPRPDFGPGPGPGPGGGRPPIELSQDERDEVRQLMRESFEAGRDAVEARRAAEKELVSVLKTEPYDAEATRAALERLQAADRQARDVVANRLFEGLGELSVEQRALVVRLMAGNVEKRGKQGERLERFRERREDRLRGEGDDRP